MHALPSPSSSFPLLSNCLFAAGSPFRGVGEGWGPQGGRVWAPAVVLCTTDGYMPHGIFGVCVNEI